MSDAISGCLGFGMLIFLAVFLASWQGCKAGQLIGENNIRAQAVEAGVAEYVVSDSAGNTEFRWKSPNPEQDHEQ